MKRLLLDAHTMIWTSAINAIIGSAAVLNQTGTSQEKLSSINWGSAGYNASPTVVRSQRVTARLADSASGTASLIFFIN